MDIEFTQGTTLKEVKDEIGNNRAGGDRIRNEITTEEEKEKGITNFLDKNKFPTREIWADKFTDKKMQELKNTLKNLSKEDKILFGESISFVSGGDFEKEFRKLIPKKITREEELKQKIMYGNLPDEERFVLEDELANLPDEKIKEKVTQKENKNIQSEVYQLLLQKDRKNATELIVQEFYKTNYIKVSRDDNNPEFKIYKNGIYVNEGKTYIEEFTREILDNAYSTHLLNDIINKISADNKVDFEQLEKERDPYLLATEDCLIDLRTGETKEFSPDIIMFNKIPVKYNPKAKCPKILKFLSEILATEEDIRLIEEIIGFSLVNDYFMEKAIMFLGNGRNGKSKLLSLMKSFFGVENTCSVRLQEMNTQSSSIWELNNRFVNLAGDLSNQSLKETGLFKETTGRDTIQAKRKYKNDLKFVNSATHIFACNDLPRVYDTSKGFWERWVLVDFPNTFLDKDEYNKLPLDKRKNKKIRNPDIINNILSDNELSGLLNLALEGLKRIQKKKQFTYSKNAEEVRNSWIRQADSFQAFAMDYLEEDYDNKISKNEIRKVYYKYCRKHRLKTSSDIAIKIILQNAYGCIETRMLDTSFGWEGVRLKPKAKPQKTLSIPTITTTNEKKILSILKKDQLIRINKVKETFPEISKEEIDTAIKSLLKKGVIYDHKKFYYQII